PAGYPESTPRNALLYPLDQNLRLGIVDNEMNPIALDRGLREQEREERGIGRCRHRQVQDTLGVLTVQDNSVVQELSQRGMKVRHERRTKKGLDFHRDSLVAFLGGEDPLSGQVNVQVKAAELEEERVGRDRPAFL